MPTVAAAPETARRDELILENLHMVRAIASSVRKSMAVHMEMDDLVHAGMMGLFDAATKYREDREVAFPVYAKHRIRGAMLDSLRQLDWASRDARRNYKQMQEVTRDLSTRLGRAATQEEVAEAMGLDERRWQSLMIDFRVLGLAAGRLACKGGEDMPLREVPSTPASCPNHVLACSEMKNKLQGAMQCLPERHQQVVKMYYEADMTMKEIGSRLGVNESRVSQIHKSALAKMHIFLDGRGISSPAAF